MAIPTASSQASSMGNLTITLPGCVNIKMDNDADSQEWNGAGGVVAFAGADAPTGWLLCNGAAVSREDYKNLFDVIGTTYGVGNGNTTFNLPDLRGRYLAGLDNMGGASANRITDSAADGMGGAFGAESIILTEAQLPAHTHSALADVAGSDGTNPYENIRYTSPRRMGVFATASRPLGVGVRGRYQRYSSDLNSDSDFTDGDNTNNPKIPVIAGGGEGEAHSNLPPTIALNYIIKT